MNLKQLMKGGCRERERERQMKKWKREWKVALIEDMNPAWHDLSINWHQNQSLVYKSKRFLRAQE